MERRFRVSAALTLPLFAIAMGDMLPGAPVAHALGAAGPWLQLALATPVVLWGGLPFFQRGIASLRTRLNMFTLIALGTGAAYAHSTLATLAPGLFPASFRAHGGAVPVYFESAAVIVTLVLLGQVLELRARQRTGAALRALLGLAPRTARRLGADGAERDVPLDHVHAGDRLRVRPGEAVPVDGVVVEGAERGRRVHGDGRADRGGEGCRRPRDRRHLERQRHVRDARRGGGPRHAPRADRGARRRGAAEPRADPGARRPRRRVVRAGGGRDRGDRFLRRGRGSAPSRGSRTLSSRRSPC